MITSLIHIPFRMRSLFKSLIFVFLLGIVCSISPRVANAEIAQTWVKSIPEVDGMNTISKDDSGNMYMSTTSPINQCGITKFNSSGTIVWSKSINGNRNCKILNSANNYLLIGFPASYNGTSTQIGKYDTDGNALWEKSYDWVWSTSAFSLDGTAIDSQDNIIVVGRLVDACQYGGIRTCGFILKISSTGTLLWSRELGEIASQQNEDFSYTGVQIKDDGNYLVLGRAKKNTVTLNQDFLISTISPTGDLIDSNFFGGAASDYASMMIKTFDAGFVITGQSGNSDYIVKLDSSGSILWTKLLDRNTGKLNYGGDVAIIEDTNHNLVLSGYSRDASNNQYTNLIKLDSAGTVIWAKEYGTSGSADTWNLRIIETSDHGYVFGGEDYINHHWNTIIAKVDANGNCTNCSQINDVSIVDSGAYGGVLSSISLPLKNVDGTGNYTWNTWTSTITSQSLTQSNICLNSLYQVSNLSSSLNVIETSSAHSLKVGSSYGYMNASSSIQLQKGTAVIAYNTLSFTTSDLDWTNVSADVDTSAGKSVVSNLIGSPGAAATLDFLIPKLSGSRGVRICPQATTLSDVGDGCPSGYNLTTEQTSLTTVTVNGIDFWKVTGIGNGGGFNLGGAPSSSNSSSSSSSSSSDDQIQIPQTSSDHGNGTFTPTKDSDTKGQNVSVVIESPKTFPFDAFLSAKTPDSNTKISPPPFTPVGQILQIWYKAYAPKGSSLEPARIIPSLQKKTSIVSLSYKDADLMKLYQSYPSFSPKSLKLAFSPDGKSWSILSSSVVDAKNKSVAAIQKIGGYYSIVYPLGGGGNSSSFAPVLGIQINTVPSGIYPNKKIPSQVPNVQGVQTTAEPTTLPSFVPPEKPSPTPAPSAWNSLIKSFCSVFVFCRRK